MVAHESSSIYIFTILQVFCLICSLSSLSCEKYDCDMGKGTVSLRAAVSLLASSIKKPDAAKPCSRPGVGSTPLCCSMSQPREAEGDQSFSQEKAGA